MKLESPPPPEYVFRYHKPPKSGNVTNGLGESQVRRATRVFHWPFGKPPHHWQALDLHFNLIGGMGGPYMGYGMIWQRLWNLWQIRRANGPVAPKRREVADPKAMAGEIKAYIQKHFTESIVGITRVISTDIVEGESVDFEYVICVGQPMERDIMLQVPKPAAGWEVMRGYRRVSKQAVKLAAHIRSLGWEAKAHADPKTGSLLHIPPAIRAGLGELGKHGSIITKEWGSNVRLAAVTTNLPLAIDDPVDIGVDDLCVTCRRCTLDCPPGAIMDSKQMVRGVEKWYVDFDKCVPYFAENSGCAICIQVCPWAEPGRGSKLSETLLAKRRKAA